MKTTKACRRLVVAAGLAAVAASASALSIDPQISIDRALNSPTLAVRYSGVTATLVELKVNGESIGTREVSAARNLGETSFTIDLDGLKNGDNLVEVRLFDRTGKLVAQDRTNISIDRGGNRGPVFVAAPKAGATVMGPVQIDVGFGANLGKSYVSFFVDGQFKSMTNFPPFNFTWDTEKEANGWHEVEAWAIDETNATHKSGTVRLFVNNPGGRTNRLGVAAGATPSANVSRGVALVGADAGTRALNASAVAIRTRPTTPQSLPPAVVERMVPLANSVRAAVVGANGLRPVVLAGSLATGPKTLLPTGRRVAFDASAPVVKAPSVKTPVIANATTKALPLASATIVAPKVTALVPKVQPVVATAVKSVPNAAQAAAQVGTMVATSLVTVVQGTRLPNLGAYTILLNGRPVRFDVPTRVDGGVALAPLRSLIEKAGGKLEWHNPTKTVRADAAGRTLEIRIGGTSARVDGQNLILERAASLDHGRTIVPLSFLHDALGMDVRYDKATGKVLVASAKK